MRGPVALLALLLVAAGCSGAPERTDPPDGLTAHVMQYRGKRLTREIALAVDNGTGKDLTITRFRLGSNRWAQPVTWTGTEEVGAGFGTGIDVDPPEGRCPDGDDLTIRADLTYRLGDEERRSRVPVEDPYGVLRDLVDGDCGAQAFAAATDLTVGEPRVAGDRWTALLTLTPRQDAERVVLNGFAPTLRFAFGPRTPTDVALDLRRSQRVPLEVVTGRCDPHVVGEDKVGTRFGVRVSTGEVDHAYLTLDLDESVRQSLEDFYAERCRL
ncbi:hypothetical protein [Aeromicrobium sp. 179-A 4D2 NHS]|uniref:hypothetical protein n=1 Tax=Aeromicrobium sp. 179-A 4D2 NHS TaxID=3142375 RepID=UPI0039A13FD6